MSPKNAKGISEIVQCSRVFPKLRGFLRHGTSDVKTWQSWLDQDIGHPGCEMEEPSDRDQHTQCSEAPAKPDSEHDQDKHWAAFLQGHPLSSPQTLFQASGSKRFVSDLATGLIWQAKEASIILSTIRLYFCFAARTSWRCFFQGPFSLRNVPQPSFLWRYSSAPSNHYLHSWVKPLLSRRRLISPPCKRSHTHSATSGVCLH